MTSITGTVTMISVHDADLQVWWPGRTRTCDLGTGASEQLVHAAPNGRAVDGLILPPCGSTGRSSVRRRTLELLAQVRAEATKRLKGKEPPTRFAAARDPAPGRPGGLPAGRAATTDPPRSRAAARS